MESSRFQDICLLEIPLIGTTFKSLLFSNVTGTGIKLCASNGEKQFQIYWRNTVFQATHLRHTKDWNIPLVIKKCVMLRNLSTKSYLLYEIFYWFYFFGIFHNVQSLVKNELLGDICMQPTSQIQANKINQKMIENLLYVLESFHNPVFMRTVKLGVSRLKVPVNIHTKRVLRQNSFSPNSTNFVQAAGYQCIENCSPKIFTQNVEILLFFVQND